jgi:hypothetical protein
MYRASDCGWTSLEVRVPPARKVKHRDHCGEDEIEERQAPAIGLGDVDVRRRRESLRVDDAVTQIPDEQRGRVNERDVQQVVEEAARGRTSRRMPRVISSQGRLKAAPTYRGARRTAAATSAGPSVMSRNSGDAGYLR